MAGILIVDQIQNSSNTLLINSGALAANTVGTSQIQSGVSLSGNIGIGQSSPAYALDVKSSSSGDTVRFNGNGGIPSFLYTDINYFGLADASGLGGNAIYGNHPSNYVSVQTNGVERVRVDSSGNLNFKTSNAGIVFNNGSASVNSTLNDYEVGSWTVTTIASNNLPTLSFTNAQYVKIGKLVTLSILGSYSTSTSGNCYFVFNAPFAMSAAAGVAVTGVMCTYNVNSQYNLNNGSIVDNSSGDNVGIFVGWYVASQSSNQSFSISITYQANF